MAVIGREAARAPLTSADINDGIVSADDLAATLDLSSKTITLGTATADAVTISPSSGDATLTLTSNASQPWEVYSPDASNDLRFKSDSTDYVTIDTSGDVGIGTTTINEKLVLGSADSGSTFLQITNSTTTAADNRGFYVGIDSNEAARILNRENTDLVFSTNNTTQMTLDSSGNLGIGTTSPGRALDVQASSQQIIATFSTGNTTQSRLTIADANTTTDYVGIGADTDDFTVFAGGSERIRVDDSGNVGIGTSSPSEQLHIANANDAVVLIESTGSDATDDANIQLKTTNGTFTIQNDRSIGTSGALTFAGNTSNNIVIDHDNGNVGVGTSSPSTQLHVNEASTNEAAITLSNNDGTYRIGANNDFGLHFADSFKFANQADTAEYMRINSSGNLLLGTTSITTDPGVQVFGAGNIYSHVAGTGSSDSIRFYRNNAQVGSIATDGTSTTYNTSSDARLKENIADAEDAASLIDAIQVRSFDWIADGSHQRYGMVAQELLEVAPEAVSGDPESDDMMGVDYSKLVPMLVKEIQSLRARVAQLEGA